MGLPFLVRLRYDSGKMVITVPDGWQVTVNCQNRGKAGHSCAIVKDAGDTTPAFPGAASAHPIQGYDPAEPGATLTFKAVNPGKYRISCLVPGHDQSGMWDTFIVAPGGEPTIKFS